MRAIEKKQGHSWRIFHLKLKKENNDNCHESNDVEFNGRRRRFSMKRSTSSTSSDAIIRTANRNSSDYRQYENNCTDVERTI